MLQKNPTDDKDIHSKQVKEKNPNKPVQGNYKINSFEDRKNILTKEKIKGKKLK